MRTNKATLSSLRKTIRRSANPEKAQLLQGFFKTGKGEYGEGDVFLGLTVPESRAIAKQYDSLPLTDVRTLLNSKYHEERLIALLLLVHLFEKGTDQQKEKIYNFYLRNTKGINNWDLVDLSAHKILGAYLLERSRKPLYKLAQSKNMWEQRIAIIATAWFISKNDFIDTLKISDILLNHEHDLIHKAVGWMLREVGKRDLATEERFLRTRYKRMPRTMLRYAIEKFPESKRRRYLKGTI